MESVRRILGDILTYSDHKIKNGLVVLSHIPPKGTVDVYTVLDKLKVFPTTADINIYFTTFNILRALCISSVSFNNDFNSILFDPSKEQIEEYSVKIQNLTKKHS